MGAGVLPTRDRTKDAVSLSQTSPGGSPGVPPRILFTTVIEPFAHFFPVLFHSNWAP